MQAGGFAESPLAGGLLSVHLAESHAGEGRGGGAVGAGFLAFAGAILILGAIGALIEAIVVGAVVAFIARVRPALLGLAGRPAPPDPRSPPPARAHVHARGGHGPGPVVVMPVVAMGVVIVPVPWSVVGQAGPGGAPRDGDRTPGASQTRLDSPGQRGAEGGQGAAGEGGR